MNFAALILFLLTSPLPNFPTSPPLHFPTPAQESRDVVRLTDGTSVEGRMELEKETPREIVVTVSGKAQTIPVDKILRIDYSDMPPSFPGVYEAIERGSYAQAITGLDGAESFVKDLKDPKAPEARKKLIPRKWFAPAVLYYRAFCLMQDSKWDKAIANLDGLIKDHAGSRFLKNALTWKLECALGAGNDAAVQATLQEMEKQKSVVGSDVIMRAEILQADHLAGKGTFDKARAVYAKYKTHSDPTIAALATAGLIRCLQGMKDAKALQDECLGALDPKANRPVGARLAAAVALGELKGAQNLAEGIPFYVQAVVLCNPGRSPQLVALHETAILRLADAYSELYKKSEGKNKSTYAKMAMNTWRELEQTYPNGRFKGTAATRAAEFEAALKVQR